MWFENPPTTSGPVLKPELYSYYRVEHGPQTITIKSKVRSNLMVLSLYKVEGGYKTKNLPNQGCLAKKTLFPVQHAWEKGSKCSPQFSNHV